MYPTRISGLHDCWKTKRQLYGHQDNTDVVEGKKHRKITSISMLDRSAKCHQKDGDQQKMEKKVLLAVDFTKLPCV